MRLTKRGTKDSWLTLAFRDEDRKPFPNHLVFLDSVRDGWRSQPQGFGCSRVIQPVTDKFEDKDVIQIQVTISVKLADKWMLHNTPANTIVVYGVL